MPFTDFAVALQIALTYFTIIYLTGLGGLFSERSGIVNIGLEGLMIIGTVTGAWGARYFTDTVGLGLPWGPILGLMVGAACGLVFAGVHAVATISFKVDHIVSGVVINLVAIGLARFLSEVFFGQATQSDPGGPHLNTINIPLLSKLPWGLGRAFEGLSPVVVFAILHGVPGVVRALPDALGPPAPIVRREPRGRPLARRSGPGVPLPSGVAVGGVRRIVGSVPRVRADRRTGTRGRRSDSGSSRSRPSSCRTGTRSG